MATEPTALPVNGNYGTQQTQHYGGAEQHPPTQNHNSASNGPSSFGSQGANVPSSTGSTSTSGGNERNTDIPKDEVGWYFVEQYYTTLSRSPEKLHLFYSKKSQFVSGVEAEKVAVSVGQRAINERIKDLEIQDCKVRVSNVDSQASFQNIVVQVIGEMSNKSAPHRKFVQTFVLAEQPNGYFVLNDIFRYINEEEEEDDLEAAPAQGNDTPQISDHAHDTAGECKQEPDPEAKSLTNSENPAERQHDAEKVNKKIEEKLLKEDHTNNDATIAAPLANGIRNSDETNVAPTEEDRATSVSGQEETERPTPESTGSAIAVEAPEAEKPKDPEPTPVASPPPAIPAETTAQPPPAKAPVKATWASMVASHHGKPAAVAPTASKPPASGQPRAAAPNNQPQAQPQQAAPASDTSPPQANQNTGSGWQTAGNEHAKRQTRPQSVSGPGDKGNVLAYVKNVSDKVDGDVLKRALLEYGEIAYFDVSRPKNCAFVEFANSAGYSAAVAANPHLIGGENIYVEERRPRPNAYGGGFNSGRGGMGRGGRGGPDGRPGNQGRGGFQKDGGRGGYAPRGRGGNGNVTPRGRGGSQASQSG
ncbi:MAG: hypothetical protein M1812_000043 [Candelaria pacifica]|nr:MAG: hypothetical protein M1812_000043 [Candelaria pacifica]